MTKILSIVKDDTWFIVNNHITKQSVSVKTEYMAFKEVERILSTIEWERQKRNYECGGEVAE